MTEILILRFDAPLVSFGAPSVDANSVIQAFPALSMLVGLFGNALGWDHRDAGLLGDLQDRLRYAARVDRSGEALVDYQTVDLGERWMLPEQAGWTTRGRLMGRGGASSEGTHQRYRHYRADSVHTVAVAVTGGNGPDTRALGTAIREPARPLFIGRKCCVPAAPLFVRMVAAPTPLAALQREPLAPRADPGPWLVAWWDGDGELDEGESHVLPVTDERDWENQIHVGRRFMRMGHLASVASHG